ncbi:MAG TPA: DUF1080 domain-containing protein, partial [Bryobacteraceae bacterium]
AATPGRGGGFRQPEPIDFNEHEGWVALFDGKTLEGWSGDENWKVEDGAIVIESTCEHPTGTVYLVWQGGEVTNFELKLEMKGTGNVNGGVQYRSWLMPPRAARGGGRPGGGGGAADGRGGRPGGGAAGGGRAGGPAGRGGGPCPNGMGPRPDPATEAQWEMGGPQYDFDAGNRYPGQFYEQSTGRGIVAWKGQVVRTETGKPPRLLSLLGDKATVDSWFKPNEYNEEHIIAIGNNYTHILNGHIASVLIDEDQTRFHASGKIGLEVESIGKLFVRNIWLKRL